MSDDPRALAEAARFIEFAPHHKTVFPSLTHAASGTFWYAEGYIGGHRYEFSAQDSRADAEWLCTALNTAVSAAIAAHDSALLTRAEAAEAENARLRIRLEESCKVDGEIMDDLQGKLQAAETQVKVMREVWHPISSAPLNTMIVVANEAFDRVDITAREQTDWGGLYWAQDGDGGLDYEPAFWVPVRAALASTPAPASPVAVQAAERMQEAAAKWPAHLPASPAKGYNESGNKR